MKAVQQWSLLQRRSLAVVLLLVVLVLAYLLLLHWWFVAPLQKIQADMADLRDTQSHYAAAIAAEPALRRRLLAVGQGQASSEAFLAANDASSGAGVLMQRIVDVVNENQANGSCEILQKTPVANMPDRPGEPYHRVGVSISLNCDVQPLAAVLYSIEQGKPYLFVDDFSAFRLPSPSPGTPMPLQAQFTIYGYLRGTVDTAAAAGGVP